ncbi:MAG: hypothetical protein MJ107_02180 [Lachnospiraceae bacterium]|nr:hypothetical protein [Lachnospiraceae bacterium]
MKKTIRRVGAIVLSAFILTCSTVDTTASEKRSYSYNYDYWGDVQDSPDLYSVCKVLTSSDFGLDKPLRSPQGLYVNGESVFICDSGNNRIIELKRTSRESLELVKIIDSVKGDIDKKEFSGPTDIAISEDGNIFIADKGNARILKVDSDYNFISQYLKPVDNTLDPSIPFAPNKIVVDTAERVYCIATGINKGLIKYETDGSFSGFVGATPASFDFTTYIWKKFATQEQLAKMVAFVPTEYDNIYMDYEGFIYACTGSVSIDDLKAGKADAVRKLNLLGNDILVENGVYYKDAFPVYGDLYMGDGGGYKGASYFSDVTCFDNDIYVCLDKNRGRLFSYDDQGNMVFCCGGNGNMDGYFRKPVGIDHMGYDLFVLDELDCSITIFTQTDFGALVFKAMDLFDEGEYEASQAAWEDIIKDNGNYDLAYIGIGRAHLRQKDYKTAMEYFELKYDDENYSKAYRQYRKIWVEENIVAIVIVLLLLFLVPMGIGRYKSIKREFDTADIFKVQK